MHREPDGTKHVVNTLPDVSQAKRQLLLFLQDNTTPLFGTICLYVQRMGPVGGGEVQTVALEVLQETVVEALDHADRFISTGQVMAWLLGIATNVIKRKRAEAAKRQQREIAISRLSVMHPDFVSESDMLDQVTLATTAGPEQGFETDEQVSALLSLVSAEDQQVLRLAFLEDFEREALGQRLGTTSGAARMRLHRALSRLRSAWHEQQMKRQRGEDNE